jgi:hypothetical protein
VAYAHDIFISYVREKETLDWLNDHLVPILQMRIKQELGHRPEIFVDDTGLESGASWPEQLGHELGRSRVLIALWAGDYFASRWCQEELAHMLARELECGMRSPENPRGLIVPAVIHDGDRFPEQLRHIQRFGVQKYFSARMPKKSKSAHKLDMIIAREAPAIAKAIEHAPEWRSAWPVEAAKELRRRLELQPPHQPRPSSFTD